MLDGLATSRYRGLDTKWPKPKCAADNWRGNKEKKKVGEEQKGNCCRKKKKLGKRKQKDKAGGVHSPGMGGGGKKGCVCPILVHRSASAYSSEVRTPSKNLCAIASLAVRRS